MIGLDGQGLGAINSPVWFQYHRRWFWPEQVMELRRLARDVSEEEASTSGGDDPDVRKNKVRWLSREEDFRFVRPIQNHVFRAAGWDFDIREIEPLQYTIYRETQDHYTWHSDDSGGSTAAPTGNIRKVTCVVQLSDPEDYDGCELELLTMRDNELRPVPISFPKEAGSIVCFPSNAMHRVTPLTRGKRESLVCWFRGPPWR